MVFQREKKELWRYASKNHAAAASGTTSQPPQPHRHQHQRLPHFHHQHLHQNCHSHQHQHQRQQQPHPHPYHHQQSTQSFGNCCGTMSNSSSTQLNNTPPPPYSSVPFGIDCSGAYANLSQSPDYQRSAFRQPASNYATDVETSETSVSATESETKCARMRHGFDRPDDSSKIGYNYGNYGDDMLVDECEKSNESNNSSSSNRSYLLTEKLRKQSRESPAPSRRQPTATTTIAATTTTAAAAAAATFASTAANMFRNCCGGGFFTESSTGSATTTSTTTTNNNNSHGKSSKNCYEQRTTSTTTRSPKNVLTPEQYFQALMKQLKDSQRTALLKAVKSRSDPATSSPRGGSAAEYQSHCILIPRSPILDEEPYVIACRLFFWPDLKYASELKRLPVCPNERDPVYVCCNPLHWCRILEETAPPPYQRPKMERLNTEDPALGVTSLNEGNSSTASTVSICSSSNNSKACVRMPESLTTDGEDRRSGSLIWCQVAYWELAQRVGARYLAKKSSINIYSDGPSSSDGISDGMCLKDLVEKKTTPSPDDVQYNRQKIGLGVTLSQEADGVWLFNRSMVPIFLYSPTLSESCFRVCKVMPGDCLRAFDSHRAHSLTNPSCQFPGVQTGPVDTFSIRISFAKGWGYEYKRQDITRCPCWLEVLFTQR